MTILTIENHKIQTNYTLDFLVENQKRWDSFITMIKVLGYDVETGMHGISLRVDITENIDGLNFAKGTFDFIIKEQALQYIKFTPFFTLNEKTVDSLIELNSEIENIIKNA